MKEVQFTVDSPKEARMIAHVLRVEASESKEGSQFAELLEGVASQIAQQVPIPEQTHYPKHPSGLSWDVG